ncbi:MAG: glycosyl hydrolase [Paludibacter sp.]|nr:glycosyl hydrolase [Paludibacter sp.]
MNKKIYNLLIISFWSTISVFSQNARTTITLTDKVLSVASYTDKEVILNSQTDLHLTAPATISSNVLNNSIVKLNSANSWLFFDNISPKFVIDSLLKYISVNNQTPVLKSNVRVSIYKHGTVVIPQSSTFQPLKVYTGQNFTGDSASYSLFNFYNALGTINNQIKSFKLKRGYMTTVATATDGTGYSRVYIADDKDLEVGTLPNLLDQSISFIRVFDWEWVTKKGWCGYNPTDLNLTKPTWRYDWSAGGATTSTVEYVPIRQNGGWPGWAEINGKQYSTHVLGFNEPDHTEQSNLTVGQAVAQWPDMIRSGLRIGSPACTNFSWLYSFMDSCKVHNYRVDYVAVHAYWGGKSPANWYNDLKYIHDRTGRPIWITEWNNGANWTTESWPTSDHSLSTANAAKQLSDLKAILNVLDTASFIERYSIYNWVQDCRAMTLGDSLTPAGKYYASDKSVMAYNKVYEVIPTFTYSNPSLIITFGPTKLTLTISDPNAECMRGFILEKKMDNGTFTEFIRQENTIAKTVLDTIDFNVANRFRYRVRTILADGTITGYSNEVGYDVTAGNEDKTGGNNFQYGNISFSNVGWNPVFYKNVYAAYPSIILGSPTNANSTIQLSARAKITSLSKVTFQLAPWSYQNISSLAKDESVPYFISNVGSYDFGTLKAQSARSSVSSAWTPVAFTAPFDTIPVVFTSQFLAATSFATTVRVRNITKTGFEAKLQKETAIKTALGTETISYFAITPGTGIIDNKKVIVGKTADRAVGTIYSTIYYGDSIPNPVFLAQMQTCNDDTITATLRCLSVTSKYASVFKQRERSTGLTTATAEKVGWMLINPVNIIQGIHTPSSNQLRFYPNPVKDMLYLNQKNTESLNIEIYNAVGVLMKRVKLNDNEVNVMDLSPGCYIIRTLQNGSGKFVKL